ncbi:23S rRNA (uracil(1939)-C(5))-methyltransferase RlmD [bacterium]|nr:23S rRNA (uracil(1939)-C(5))-methyltransferase RlmD [bacterium]
MKLKIEKLADNGFGVGFLNEKEIFIPYTLPGEEIFIEKIQKRKGKNFALEFRVVSQSKKRVEPRCPYFEKCGGCLFQHLSYKDQIKFKREKLKNLFQRKIKVLPSPKQFGYRGKIDIVVSSQGIGFRQRGFWNKVIEIDECPLFGDNAKKSLSELRKLIREQKISLYDLESHKGLIRYLVLREGKFTGQLMVNLVTKREIEREKLTKYFNFAQSFYLSLNPGLSDVSFGKPLYHFKDEFIQEKILGITYFIHPNTFFQSNSYQLKNLLKLIAKFVKGKKVLDLYCGVGTFAIFLAKKGYLVDALELSPSSVKMAKLNAMANDVYVNFQEGRAEEIDNLNYDTVIVDPPRPGLGSKIIKKLNESKIQRLIYVSCNPHSLAQNISQLKNFSLKKIIGIDMFPQTPEVETIAALDRK